MNKTIASNWFSAVALSFVWMVCFFIGIAIIHCMFVAIVYGIVQYPLMFWPLIGIALVGCSCVFKQWIFDDDDNEDE